MSISWGTQYSKLKTNLRLAINRLKLLEKKKTEMALKSRTEIADFIASSFRISEYFLHIIQSLKITGLRIFHSFPVYPHHFLSMACELCIFQT